MQKKNLTKAIETERKESFTLPRNIKSREETLSDGTQCYVFRHDELGDLGRILIIPRGADTEICYEVMGDPDDPMTEKRRAIFEPISKEISERMSPGCEQSRIAEAYVSSREKRLIEAMEYPCPSCKATTAALVFAKNAETAADLEDYACLVYSKIKELNVPTWIVGRETENIVNGEDLRKALVLKVHPKREKAKIMTPDALMDIIEKLMEVHCI